MSRPICKVIAVAFPSRHRGGIFCFDCTAGCRGAKHKEDVGTVELPLVLFPPQHGWMPDAMCQTAVESFDND